MAELTRSRLRDVLRTHQADILRDWTGYQARNLSSSRRLVTDADLARDSGNFLKALVAVLDHSDVDGVNSAAWQPVRDLLVELSATRARLGFSPSETATFVFSLKQPIFDRLRAETPDPQALADDLWAATRMLDSLGLFTTEAFLKSRDLVIARQQQEMMELSTPVVSLWKGVLALPLIGTLDSARTQVVMENLLQRIVDTGASIAILDITGVPTVDTLVAQHLLKTVAAARLMGAECIISGIRPQIAQTIVHLGVDLSVTTKATLADAFAIALKRLNLGVQPVQGTRPAASAH